MQARLVHRQAGRALQCADGEPGPGEDFPHPGDVEVLAGMAGRGQGQQLAVQVEAAAHHRSGLQRLVGRPGEDRLVHGAGLQHRAAVGAEADDRAAVN